MNKIPLIFGASIAAAVIITILAMTIINPQSIEDILEPSFSVGPTGTFYQPRDVALNSTGHIFVADTRNNRVQIFNTDGSFNATFGFPDNNVNDGSFNLPFGIAINGTDFVYVADTFTHVIKVFDPNGVYIETIGIAGTGTGEYYRPSGITTNTTHIFVADTFNDRIQIVTTSDTSVISTIP